MFSEIQIICRGEQEADREKRKEKRNLYLEQRLAASKSSRGGYNILPCAATTFTTFGMEYPRGAELKAGNQREATSTIGTLVWITS